MSKKIGAARQHPKRGRRVVGMLALAAAGVMATASPAFADPPTNSSFEDPDVVTGAGVFLAGDTSITGWTIPYGSVDIQEMSDSPFGPAPDGDQILDLSGSTTGGRGALQQSFPTVAGTGYTISWNYGALALNACQPSHTRSATFSVQGSPVISMSVNPISTADPNWQTGSTTFTGTGSPVLLQFADTTSDAVPAPCGLAIDNIQIGIDTSVPIVDPEVAAGVLGAAGVAAAGWFVYRRRGGSGAVASA